jgi:hypothetical protein
MKANELRLGNYVYDNLGGVLKIKGISLDSTLSHIKPIPLTEEWFLKFGFHKKYKSYEKGDFSFINGGYNKLAYKLSIIENTPKYVHQLQNLYFALTGEELTIEGNNE